MTLPADIANRALDAIGVDYENPIGDLQEGTKLAAAALRVYGPTMRQMLRAVHWNFARKQAPLTLLQDRTGQTTAAQIANGFPVTVGTGTIGMGEWLYEYAWPIDGMKARWLPWNNLTSTGIPNGNIVPGNQLELDGGGTLILDGGGGPLVLDNAPPTNTLTLDGGGGTLGLDGGGGSLVLNPPGGTPTPPTPIPPISTALMTGQFCRQVPARFLVSQDNSPALVGAVPSWDQAPQLWNIQGAGPATRTVILTNVPCATLVYTALIVFPEQWDPLFQQAMVASLAASLAVPLLQDKKFALEMRGQMVAMAKEALAQARVSDGNEGFQHTIDHTPDWLRTRTRGGRGYNGGSGWEGPGQLNYGWDSCSFADGSVF